MDDNAGLQYHFPITSSNNGTGPSGRKGAQLSVVHVAVEMAPIAKVGRAHGRRAGRARGGPLGSWSLEEASACDVHCAACGTPDEAELKCMTDVEVSTPFRHRWEAWPMWRPLIPCRSFHLNPPHHLIILLP